MKLVVHKYYVRSRSRREMDFTKKSIKTQHEENPSRVPQDKYHRPWMNDIHDEDNFGEENEVVKCRTTPTRRRSPTLDRDSMFERRFNLLILAIHNTMGIINTVQKKMNIVNKFIRG